MEFAEIADFLYSQGNAHPKAAFVGFYLGYDFGQWFRTLPEGRARSLIAPEGIAKRQRREEFLPPFPVYFGDWEFDQLAGRRFKLRPLQTERQRKRLDAPDPWMTVCDVGPFFQCSFLRAIDPSKSRHPICTLEEYRIIAEGKAARGTERFGPDMLRYNALECDVLARMMREQNRGFVAEGVRLRRHQWIGPGQVAQGWLNNIKAPTAKAVQSGTDPQFRQAAADSYFGGWFEIFYHGPAPGVSYHYDINSAYPDIMSRLPCLLHGHTEHGTGGDLSELPNGLTLLHARVWGSNPLVGAMMHRRPNRGVLRPRFTEGWYWRHELQAAIGAGLIDRVHVGRWHSYRPCDCPPPIAAIRELYEGRLRIGKETPEGKARKLIYNSGYGKFTQSVGNPRYGNAIYASLITAGCRTRILEAIGSHPKAASDLLMVATDGIVFKSPHPALDIDNERLGAWSAGTYSNLSLFMPGVYWDDVSRETLSAGNLKTRGISARDLSGRIAIIDRAWERFADDGWPRLVIPVAFQLVSPRQALARGKWETAGTVITKGSRIISADPKPKRVGHGPGASRPYARTPEGASLPYHGTFGEELRLFDQDEFGDHPEGPIGDVLMRELWR